MSDKILQQIVGLLTEVRDRLPLSNPVSKTSADGRFIDCGEYIKDTWEHTMPDGSKKRFMWMKTDTPSKLTNQKSGKAEKWCEKQTAGGFTDWKLPLRAEMITLIDDTKEDPAADPILNLKTDDFYWTRSEKVGNSGGAWVVGFSGGYVGWSSRDNYYYVRAVRQY
jgi:hypothetical protein